MTLARSSVMGVMVFLSRSSEEQANVFVVGLISQVPLAFWKRATVPEATEALPTWRRYCGEVVPMPTLPLLATYKSLTPLLDATFNIGKEPLPCTTKVLPGLVVPMPTLPNAVTVK